MVSVRREFKLATNTRKSVLGVKNNFELFLALQALQALQALLSRPCARCPHPFPGGLGRVVPRGDSRMPGRQHTPGAEAPRSGPSGEAGGGVSEHRRQIFEERRHPVRDSVGGVGEDVVLGGSRGGDGGQGRGGEHVAGGDLHFFFSWSAGGGRGPSLLSAAPPPLPARPPPAAGGPMAPEPKPSPLTPRPRPRPLNSL